MKKTFKASKRNGIDWALWGILAFMLLGGIFRFTSLNWDKYHSFHPDERNILGQTAGIQENDGFRVRFFAYGQLPVYLYRATAELVSVPQFFGSFVNGGRGVTPVVQAAWWVLLALLLGGLIWLGFREKWKVPVAGTAATLFAVLVFLDLFPVFTIWFRNLDVLRVKAACFLFVTAAAFGASVALARLMERDWFGLPFYAASGATFLFGALPLILPQEAFARVFGLLAFTFLLFAGMLWWAWVSRIGRAALLVLCAWIFLAAQPNPGPHFIDYKYMMVIGRWWSALFSTLTIGGVYLLVRRIYRNTFMALLASGGFAFAAVSIQYAHYCVTESFITFLVVAVAYASVSIWEKGSWRDYLIAGACFGLAMSSKTSALFYIFMIVAAHLVALARRSAAAWINDDKRQSENRELFSVGAGLLLAGVLGSFLGAGMKLKGFIGDLFERDPRIGSLVWMVLFAVLAFLGLAFTLYGLLNFKALRGQMPQWIKLAAAGGLAFMLFCTLSPWSLVDNQGFASSQNYEWNVVSKSDACYVLQFKDTPRYLFHLANLMHVELWWPLGIAAVLGTAWVLLRFLLRLAVPVKGAGILPVPFLKNKSFAFSLPDLLLLAWLIPYFGFIGAWNTKFVRYMIPLIPFFCVFAARGFVDLFDWLGSKWKVAVKVSRAVAAILLASTLFYATAYMAVYTHPHPWIEASVWIFKNIPPGSYILKEHWDDGLPTGVEPWMDKRVTQPMGPQNYREEDIPIYETFGYSTDDSPVKKQNYVDLLSRGEYISIASKKLWYTLTDSSPEFRPKGFNRYSVTSRYYRALWTGLLGYKMVAEINNFPRLFGWVHPDDMAEESFSVYDHPRVYLFKKVEDVPKDRILRLISTDDYVKGIRRSQMRLVTPKNVDDFIAKHRAKLAKEGLLERLDSEVTAAQDAAAQTPREDAKRPKPAPERRPAAPPKTPASPAPVTQAPEQVSAPPTVPKSPDVKTLSALQQLSQNPVIVADVNNPPSDPTESLGYQLRAWFSWVLFLMVLGWMALPLTLRLMTPMAQGAYSLSKFLGMLVFTWAVWLTGSLKVLRFTQASCWGWLVLLGALAGWLLWKDQGRLREAWKKHSRSWMVQEGAFLLAFALFTLVRIHNPHIHDPSGEGYSGGGEAGMDFGFLTSVVRGETFPPQNMWMAGLPIGYTFYYGHLMMGVITKTLGLVPAVTYNLGVITLFASIFSGAFGLAVALSGRLSAGWLAGFLCAAAGNLAGVQQVLKALQDALMRHNLSGFFHSTFDYWGPSRVIPHSINEFPYFSVLFADMHAHTLAQPFALLLVALAGSWYLGKGPLSFRNDWPQFLVIGFTFVSLAFFNTWELPTWLALITLVMVLKGLSGLKEKVLVPGSARFVLALGAVLLLLSWFSLAMKNMDRLALGGRTLIFAGFFALGCAAAWAWIFTSKSTRPMGARLAVVALALAGTVGAGFLLWLPRFIGFTTQQSEVLWVDPKLRTALGDYLTIYGAFLSVLLLGFLPVYGDAILKWMGASREKAVPSRRKKSPLFDFWTVLDRVAEAARKFLNPKGPVAGLLSLGAVLLLLTWGASLLHFSEPGERMPFALLGATLVFALFAAAYLNRNLLLAGAGVSAMVLWLGLYAVRVVQIFDDHSFTLGLAMHAVLWLIAFFFLGLALKTYKSDRGLSFTYVLAAMVFLITAVLEVFVMKEFLGGEWMRNNSLFKFGINAWELAAVAAGALFPRLADFGKKMLSPAVKREGAAPRRLLLAGAWFFLFAVLAALLSEFTDLLRHPAVNLLNLVLFGGSLALFWDRKGSNTLLIVPAVLVSPLLLLPVLPLSPSGFSGVLMRTTSSIAVNVVLPAALAGLVLWAASVMNGARKDFARSTAVVSWKTLFVVLLAMAAVYPVMGSIRKCHGFLPQERARRMGYSESPTLNGLAYIRRINPYDGAAIRFLNERIPDQPCLVETVGIGYNSWGSRFSIFTGVPALMGWDGHVREWVGHLPNLSNDIGMRYKATEEIFNTTEPDYAKRLMDAYGVRLVMVGPLERGRLDSRRSYTQAGLDKFKGWLPLVYQNPGVDVYYNPPGPVAAPVTTVAVR